MSMFNARHYQQQQQQQQQLLASALGSLAAASSLLLPSSSHTNTFSRQSIQDLHRSLFPRPEANHLPSALTAVANAKKESEFAAMSPPGRSESKLPPPPAIPRFTPTVTTGAFSPVTQQQQQGPLPETDMPTSDHNDKLTELRTRARQHMDEAIRLLPLETKEAYLEALTKVPYLMEEESNPLHFLRRCDYNLWQASERLCLYWKERKALFGPDRAFLPLTLTGDGALNKDDVLSLQAGFPVILPGTTDNGQQVAYCDRRQFIPSLNAANRLRGIFYLIRVLAEDERAQVDGVLVFILLVTPRVQEVDYAFVRKAFDLAVNVMPVKVKIHLINSLPKNLVSSTSPILPGNNSGENGNASQKTSKIHDIISKYVANILPVTGLGVAQDIQVHFERQPGELLALLESPQFGLKRSSIPHGLGGTWNFVEFISWCRKQALQEREKYKSALQAAAKNRRKQQQKRDLEDEEPVDLVTSDPQSNAAATKNYHNKRATNVIHSRRKRERKRQELINLRREHEQLEQEHAVLKGEHARLQQLLEQAQQLVPNQPDILVESSLSPSSVFTTSATSGSSTTMSSSSSSSKRSGDMTLPSKKPKFVHAAHNQA
ncbi:hypothetical protein ACA910_006583 [Epithemia clementina (nom. ined.)]